MDIILDSDRDRRTLEWLITQVGEDAINEACLQLAGTRKPYVSNIAKVLGLVPPDTLLGPSRAEARLRLVAVKNLLAKKSS